MVNLEDAKKMLADLVYDEKVTDKQIIEVLRYGIRALTQCQGEKEVPKTRAEIVEEFLEHFPVERCVYTVHRWGVMSEEVCSYQLSNKGIYGLDRYDEIIGKAEDLYDSKEEAMAVWKELYEETH